MMVSSMITSYIITFVAGMVVGTIVPAVIFCTYIDNEMRNNNVSNKD